VRAVAIAEDKEIRLTQVDPPRPGPGEVLVAVRFCGICGSDLHMPHSVWGLAGLVMGHEFSGVIAEIGPGVGARWSIADRVAVLPIDACGECRACRAGDGICLTGLMKGPGLGRPGAYAESLAVPAGMLHRLPDQVSDEGGAIAEPLAVAIRGIERSGATAADRVCVLGAGPIGYMTAAALAASGLHRVAVVDPNARRRAKVSELGMPTSPADDAPGSVPAALGGPPDVVIDCSGHPSGISLAVSLIRAEGRIAVVGVPSEPVPTDYTAVVTKELAIVGSAAYTTANFEAALAHLAAGHIPVDKIVTGVVPLEDAPDAFRELLSGDTDHVKVLLRP
jgi:(R,R)-butanediol dehydrogenase / meso-butanediol dehydrogenase / diacetyl reductase